MAQFALKFISGKYHGGEVPLPEDGEMTIGRASDLDLVLVEDMVSRKHAKIMLQGGQLAITDLGSTNGTFVNGEKIKRADLKRADRILIGTSILKVILAAEMTTSGPGDRDSLREMMEDLAANTPESATMSGDLADVPLPDLLQLFATNKKSGVLTISGAYRGKVYIRGGQMQYAVITGEPSMRPMKALCRMVGWDKGGFSLEEWDGKTEFAESFSNQSTESVLMEALRQHDELRNMMGDIPAPDAALTLRVPIVPKLSALKEGELDTLQAAINFGQFQAAVDKAPVTDFEAVCNLRKLLREGFLDVAGK
jgi:pSer/pThr/pTyr-binding forkhead associated (FHA) protein